MGQSDDLAAAGALTIARARELLAAGAVSSLELTEECLRRIERLEPRLLACVTVMADTARAEARAADAARAAGDARPLLGIPLAIKDLIQTRGVRTTAGSRVLADWLPDADAMVVTKLRDAGAVPLCKTNTHEFAYGTATPPTRNPWDLERVPGGSSGGSAAAVATGEALGALGTDTGGSIRIPAAACGVTGLKPTFGLVSRAGIIPLSWSLDHAGPIARTAADCALLLDALAGYDAADPDSIHAPETPPGGYAAALAADRTPEDALRGMRIGVPVNYFTRHVDAEVNAAVRAAIAALARLGADVREVTLPAAIDETFAVYRAIQRPEAYTYHADQGWLETRADLYRPAILEVLKLGAQYTASDYIRAQQSRRAFTDGLHAVMVDVDALATPTLPLPARRIDEIDTPVLWDGQAEPAGESVRFTFPFDLTGQPALTVPCGFTTNGLPIGLQLAGRHLADATLLRIGQAYQRMTDWHTHMPAIVTG